MENAKEDSNSYPFEFDILVWQERKKQTQIVCLYFLSFFNLGEKSVILELKRPLEMMYDLVLLHVKENEAATD